MSLVDLTADGGVRTITLNAPDRLNALDRPLLDELRTAVQQVADDSEARALVVTGAGRLLVGFKPAEWEAVLG